MLQIALANGKIQYRTGTVIAISEKILRIIPSNNEIHPTIRIIEGE